MSVPAEVFPVGAPAPATAYDGADVLVFTEFASRYPRTRADLTEHHLSPDGLAAFLADPPRRPTKAACPLITPARFGDVPTDKGYLRHDANVVALSGLLADYDDKKVSVEEALRMLWEAGIEAYLYTTASHTPVAPRYRIAAPFAHTYEDDPSALKRIHARMMARLNGALGGILAPESFSLSQSYYFGRIDGVPFEYGSTEAWGDAHPELWPEVDDDEEEEDAAADGGERPVVRRRPWLSCIDDLDELDEDAIGKGGERTEAPRADTREPGVGADDPRERAKLRACLDVLATLDARRDPYELWLAVGMALHHFFAGASEGLAWWEEWSAQRPKATGRYTCAQKWETFHTERGRGGKVVTVATLYRLADQHAPGWRRALGAQVGPVALAAADGAGEAAGRATAAPGGAQGPQGPQGLALPPAQHLTTDQANAERLAKAFGADLFVVGGRWHVWTGTHWRADEGEVYRLALRLSALIHAEADDFKARAAAAASADERERLGDLEERLRKWAARSEDKAKIDAALGLLRKVTAVDPATVDAARHLLNVRNGTLDLRTGELRGHDPRDRITRLIDINYDPNAQAPRFRRFLREIMGETDGPTPVGDFLRRLYGYCATGETREHSFTVLWGDGGNGKSRLVEAVESVLGPYAGAAAPSLLMAGAQNRHETELADLFGRRLVTAAESSEGGELAEAQVKRITGGDRIKARFMRQDHFEFPPTHKVQLQTNHKPVIRGQDRGLWRRVLLIPFTQTFGTTADVGAGHAMHLADPTLAEQLRGERAGILAWLVAGAREWYAQGLNPPDVVRAATADYREEQDRVGQFVAEECEIDAEAWAPLQAWGGRPGLYSDYREWCRDCGYNPLGLGKFKAEVERRVPGARWEARTIPGDLPGMRATKAGVWGVRLTGDD